jgi:hypothetical protein
MTPRELLMTPKLRNRNSFFVFDLRHRAAAQFNLKNVVTLA